MKKEHIIGLVIFAAFLGAIAYFFISGYAPKGEIPSYVTGDVKMMYEWAKTTEGKAALEQIPCYCGCKYEDHKHARHCFWTDEERFDKHGISCTTCLDIAKKTKTMYDEGKSICDIRKLIDDFYKPNAHLGTETPMPAGCE